jgi:hypothetical protein
VPRKPVQQRLSFPDPPGLTCPAGREEPSVWIRRIVIWHDVGLEPVRTVALGRGLNIVWSPTGPGPDAVTTGHAAGKSLFCRLVRYCLGEASFADPEDTIAIRARFPSGAVGAEIRVQGETWVVRRGLAVGHDDRAAKAETVDVLGDDRGVPSGYNAFVGELASAFFGVEEQEFAKVLGVHEPWQFILAWLTRDQECRVDGLTHWRHADSSSHSPVRSAHIDARLRVLRVALGLIRQTQAVSWKA